MALTLEQVRKTRNQKSNTLKYNTNRESKPYEAIKGELKKPEDKLVLLDKKLEKVENHTTRLIQKSKEHEERTIAKASAKHSERVVKPSPKHSLKRQPVSYLRYMLMKGIKKNILNYIKENMYDEDGETYSFIDTEDIRTKFEVSPNILRDTIYKLKKDGWFVIIHQHYSKRMIKIEKKFYTNK